MASVLTLYSLFIAVFLSLGSESKVFQVDNGNMQSLGCWRDRVPGRALPHLVVYDRPYQIAWHDYHNYLINFVNRCAQASKNYTYFAVQFYGECWAGDGNYKRYKSSGNCVDGNFKKITDKERGTGKTLTNYVYKWVPSQPGSRGMSSNSSASGGNCFSVDDVNIYGLGCWKDKRKNRALPHLVLNDRRKKQIKWSNYKNYLDNFVIRCARAAIKFRFFAVQFYGECWAGNGDYRKHGKSKKCKDGNYEKCEGKLDKICTGQGFANYVYTWELGNGGLSGVRRPMAGQRIIGGTKADPGEWPWQAKISVDGEFQCGGSLIDSCTVLTARHCVTDCGIVLPADLFNVTLGDWKRSVDEATEQVFNVKDITVHPLYDIALLQLKRSPTINANVQIISLAVNQPQVNTQAYVTGWGMTLPSVGASMSDILQELTLPVQTAAHCATNGIFIRPEEICAGSDTNSYQNVCHGDSGGPMVVQNTNSTWEQVGVTSRGISGCPAHRDFAAFVSVPFTRGWILDNLETNC